MILLNASQLSKAYGVSTILDNISFTIEEGDRIGILGVNGAGKTTLFKLLTGELTPDSGEIYKNKQLKVSYMEQHPFYESTRTVLEEVLSVFEPLIQMEQQVNELQKQLEHSSDEKQIARYHSLSEQLIQQGGLTYYSRVLSTLSGLGFSEKEHNLSLSLLSGGQRTRVMLAKILLEKSDILLLDEPTNHLDINAITWLEDFLKNYKGTLLLITHDRFFLNKVTTKIFEVEHHKLKEYKGNYTYYIQKKEADQAAAEKDYQLKQKEIARLEGIIAQQRQWNREKNIKTAESKQKMIDRIEKTMVRPDEKLRPIQFRFSIQSDCANDVLTVKDLKKSFPNKPLFDHVNLDIKKGETVFLMGENGCGKTTLFKLLTGALAPDNGCIKFGSRVKAAYYDQTQSDLSMNKTIFQEVSDALPHLDNTTIRSALAAFLFRGDDVFKEISTLSGGEKARVCLTKLMLSKANFLLLDEPTNHLDIPSKEALETALSGYDGTLLIISHDRYFVNKLADRIYELTPSGEKMYLGNYDTYLQKRQSQKKVQPSSSSKGNEYRRQKELESQKRKLQTAVQRQEQTIALLEAQIDELNIKIADPDIAADYEKVMTLSDQMHDAQNALSAAMEQWEAALSQLEEVQKE